MRTVALGVLLCSIVLAALTAQENRLPPAVRFEERPCPFAADAGVDDQVRCGSISILEDRSAPDGRRLSLAVAIVRSLSQSPRPDPIVWLAGGLGGRLVARAPAIVRSGVLDGWRADRDVILYDQRGAGLSEPRLCPEEAANWQGQPGREDSLAFRARRREVAARCRESFGRAGFNLSQYNSAVSAHDLQDLRRALGYKQWNLYGPSYGARLALVAMRDAPEGIRSAIVAAPIPPPNVASRQLCGEFAVANALLRNTRHAQPVPIGRCLDISVFRRVCVGSSQLVISTSRRTRVCAAAG
jgi:pimeloyl-ACP methyl ester carboxylesterase